MARNVRNATSVSVVEISQVLEFQGKYFEEKVLFDIHENNRVARNKDCYLEVSYNKDYGTFSGGLIDLISVESQELLKVFVLLCLEADTIAALCGIVLQVGQPASSNA